MKTVMTKDVLERIIMLNEHSVPLETIAELCGYGYSTVCRYIKTITQISDGTPITNSSMCLNVQILKEWAEEHGYEIAFAEEKNGDKSEPVKQEKEENGKTMMVDYKSIRQLFDTLNTMTEVMIEQNEKLDTLINMLK